MVTSLGISRSKEEAASTDGAAGFLYINLKILPPASEFLAEDLPISRVWNSIIADNTIPLDQVSISAS